MKPENDAPPSRPEAPPALMGGAAVPVELLGPVLAEFPDPVVVTTDADFRIYRRHSRQVIPCLLP